MVTAVLAVDRGRTVRDIVERTESPASEWGRWDPENTMNDSTSLNCVHLPDAVVKAADDGGWSLTSLFGTADTVVASLGFAPGVPGFFCALAALWASCNRSCRFQARDVRYAPYLNLSSLSPTELRFRFDRCWWTRGFSLNRLLG